ncbi:hypothetical protein EJB05_13265 [Eragrostis curvula]|uniref:Uncharacterized protein n=1 Tax=Eragrostis curvula TaxID=38414 RepID=A0A5J9VW46_9POAL|nr:hypothetical protein EJB05_13265 [Eragrostis curvula]
MQRCATQLPLSLSRLHEPTGSMCEVSERMYTTYRKNLQERSASGANGVHQNFHWHAHTFTHQDD